MKSYGILLALLGLALPTEVKAQQFTWTIINNSITITGCNPAYSIINIPSSIEDIPVTSIGLLAFSGYNIKSVTIPDSVTTIGVQAFYFCTNLTSVSMGKGVQSIGDNSFFGCYSLTSITIPNSVNSVGTGAFSGCVGLTNATIGTSVNSIGESAFKSCINLTNITIPNSVTTIWGDAFRGCSKLTSATIGKKTATLWGGVFSLCSSLKRVYFFGNFPQFLKSDGSYGGVFGWDGFNGANNATVYYFPETTGWSGGYFPPNVWIFPWDPQAKNIGLQNNVFGFNIYSGLNIPIVVLVEACTNLNGAIWTPLKTCSVTNGAIYFSDSAWTNYPFRIYRIRPQ